MRAVLRHRDFRLLWAASSASTLGDRIVFVALALYVTEIGSPSDVGLVSRRTRSRSWGSC